MARNEEHRRVATVLFLDIVDSTRIATALGDRRWRHMVASFRRIVRRELRRHRGQEVDTAGDGFFATFDRPADAVRCALALTHEVQSIGLDIRCGLHAAALERIDRRFGGIGAHIGARVMATAGAAEVVVTGTVRELLVGGDATFESRPVVQLKGVPGEWSLHRLVAVGGQPAAAPLSADVAERHWAEPIGGQRRASRLVGVLSVLGLVILGGVLAATRFAPPDTPLDSATVSPSGAGDPEPPIALVRLDRRGGEVLTMVRDEHVSIERIATIWADGGNLWYTDLLTLDRRDLTTGAHVISIELPPTALNVFTAFGSVWVAHGMTPTVVDRFDPISGRRLARIEPGVGLWDITPGSAALYGLASDSEMIEIDPLTNQIVDRDPTGTETEPVYLQYHDGLLLLCECRAGRVASFDPDSDAVVATIDFPELGFGPVDPRTGLLWLIDREASTVTPFDVDDGSRGRSLGLEGPLGEGRFGFGALWIAAGTMAHRIDSFSSEVDSYPLPAEMFAASVAVDEETESLWISSCECTSQH